MFTGVLLKKDVQICIALRSQQPMSLKAYLFSSFILISAWSSAQQLEQTVRGTVRDAASLQPLSGATVTLVNDSLKMGAYSDEQGNFEINHVPIGRYDVACSFLGYEIKTYYQQDVTTGKELIIDFELDERISETGKVMVIAFKDKSKTINENVSVSGRTFSVEESMRYAGSKGDVARMAQNFAGVQGSDDSRNDIVVRGNSPMGVLYRLEGVDIPIRIITQLQVPQVDLLVC